MRQALFSTITFIIFSVMLTACVASSGADTAENKPTDPTNPNDNTVIDPVVMLPYIEPYISPIDTIDALDSPALSTGHDSLTAVSTAANGGEAIDYTIQGLAVLRNDSTIYSRDADTTEWHVSGELNTEVTVTNASIISRITAPTVTLTFGVDGTISGVTVYADDTYSTGATADRSSGFFGFDSDYMAYITWDATNAFDAANAELEQTAYDKDGVMIAGIESTIADIPNAGIATFTGKGAGSYYRLNSDDTVNDNYDTKFDVTATADFSASTVTFDIDNTKCVSASSTGCASDNEVKTGLDFTTGALKFLEGQSNVTNNISADLTVAGMVGTLDARFYGDNGNDKARELGGTFAVENAPDAYDTRYYYGAFGGVRSGITEYSYHDTGITNPTANNA